MMNGDIRIRFGDMGAALSLAAAAMLLASTLILSAVGPARAGEAPMGAHQATLAASRYLA